MQSDQTIEPHADLREHKLPVLLTDEEFEQLRALTDLGRVSLHQFLREAVLVALGRPSEQTQEPG